jgi:hypothetical protein
MPNFVEVEKSKNNAWIPMAGFITMLILAVIAFLLAPGVQDWLMTTSWSAGGTRILPMRFPADWSDLMNQAVVALGIWLPMFVIVMIGLFMFMGTSDGPTDISLKQIREEKKKMSGGRRRS